MRRWVIKAGSQMVVEGGPLLLGAWMNQVARLRKRHGVEVIWVTSGAIAWACERTDFRGRTRTLPEKQALSAIGQPLVMDHYLTALSSAGLIGAQILLTADDLKHRGRARNLRNSLEQLLSWRVTPILNENDAVATDEIKFGDNDSLAAKVAVAVKAERLVLLTDVDGLYDADPKRHRDAKLVASVPRVTPALLKSARGRSSLGTGGMYSKLLAGERARRARVPTHLIRGDVPDGLLRQAKNEALGTTIGGAR